MDLATVYISGRDWLWPAGALLLAASLLVFWNYRVSPERGWVRPACIGLKLIGLLALALCLLEPFWSAQRAKPGANLFAVLADNSQGLQIKDAAAAQSRGEQLRQTLNNDAAPWQPALEENFQVRRYLFDARLQPVKDFSSLTFSGSSSALGAALRQIAERYEGRPLAGVLLFTDGNATDLAQGMMETTGLPPIYPVVLGQDTLSQDLAIRKITVSQTAFEDAPVTVQAEISASGYAGANVVAQLVAIKDRTNVTGVVETALPSAAAPPPWVESQTVKVTRSEETVSLRFQLRPAQPGLSFYQLRISAASELDQFQTPGLSREATLVNNTRTLVVDRGQGPYRILYVGGRPNWEFKFLNRALSEDDQIQLVGLLRIAKREPKFEFKGRQGESSNPLFRGFDRKTEETEQYDQPVLVRLNTRDEFELKGGFPITEEELYGYHAVILDDVEAGFFTRDQMNLIQRFVSERGGGFLMLGGVDTFQAGRYQGTPVANLIPVYLDSPELPEAPNGLRLEFTTEGWLQPWARLRSTERDEQARLDALPGFQVLNPARGIKPGAMTVATVTDRIQGRLPALVTQRFGHGRSAAFLVGDFWRSGLREDSMLQDMAKAWRQMIRWLVADVPPQTGLLVQTAADDPNQAVRLEVRARDKAFHPLDNASVTLDVRAVLPPELPPDKGSASSLEKTETAGQTTNAVPPAAGTTLPTIRLAGEAALTEPGLYQATYIPRISGGYRVEAVVTDPNAGGKEVGRAVAGWTSEPAAEEFQSLKPNRALLETIAQRTGGRVLALADLDGFARDLPQEKVPITETLSVPLWHQAAVFLFALACFITEWGLRRWKGLA